LIPSLLRTLVSIYWFSFQTLVGASAIVVVLAKITGTTYPLIWVSMTFGLIQACVAVIGFGSLKVLARVALPIKVIVLAYLFVLYAMTIRISSLPKCCPTRALAAGPGFCWRAGSTSRFPAG
jgi:purine-cytosine permease-like protein